MKMLAGIITNVNDHYRFPTLILPKEDTQKREMLIGIIMNPTHILLKEDNQKRQILTGIIMIVNIHHRFPAHILPKEDIQERREL